MIAVGGKQDRRISMRKHVPLLTLIGRLGLWLSSLTSIALWFRHSVHLWGLWALSGQAGKVNIYFSANLWFFHFLESTLLRLTLTYLLISFQETKLVFLFLEKIRKGPQGHSRLWGSSHSRGTKQTCRLAKSLLRGTQTSPTFTLPFPDH